MHARKIIAGMISAVLFAASANIAVLEAESKNTVNNAGLMQQSMLPINEAAMGRHSFSKPVSIQAGNDFDVTAKLPEDREIQRIDRMLQRICHGEKTQYVFSGLNSEIKRRAP